MRFRTYFNREIKTHYKVGIVGYSSDEFDAVQAINLVRKTLDSFNVDGANIELVSGLTAMGIPLIAYHIASRYNYKLTGIACKKAFEYELVDVDEIIIVGNDWGDESQAFINYIDILIRIGGNNQSKHEVDLARQKGIQIIEYNL